MGTDANHHQPLGLKDSFGIGFRIAQIGKRRALGFLNGARCTAVDEDRLALPFHSDALAILNL